MFRFSLIQGGLLLLCLAGPAAAENKSQYQVVLDWPKMPDGMILGHVPGLDVDSHNHVWAYNRGYAPVVCFDGETGETLKIFGQGLFIRPHGLRVDHEDNVWITDKDYHLIYKFSHEGELLMVIGSKGVPGLDANHFDGPADIDFSPDGKYFYLADGYQNNRIVKFTMDGRFVTQWGRKGTGPGEFDVPHSVCTDAEGRVYVADRSNARVQVFDENGKFLAQWKGPEIGRPWGVTVGPDNRLYVVDGGDGFFVQDKLDPNPKVPDRGRVVIMDLEGNVLESFGSYGQNAGQFVWPHSVAIGRDGAVYVAEVHTGMRVQKFVPVNSRQVASP